MTLTTTKAKLTAKAANMALDASSTPAQACTRVNGLQIIKVAGVESFIAQETGTRACSTTGKEMGEECTQVRMD